MSDVCVHATTVTIDGHAVLLTGPSGSGKSDLALRLIDRGAALVSDDQTVLTVADGRLRASAPPTIRGKIEVRGLGIVARAPVQDVPVALVIVLGGEVDRMPLPATRAIAGVTVPEVALDAFEISAAIKVEMALAHVTEGA